MLGSLFTLLRLQILGFRRPFDEGDVPKFMPSYLSAGRGGNADRIVDGWTFEVASGKPSLLRFLLRLLRFEITTGLVWGFFFALLSCLVRPIGLKLLIDKASDRDLNTALLFSLLLSACVLCEGVCNVAQKHNLSDRTSTGFTSAFAVLIQRKSLRIAAGVGGETTERTLINSDVTEMRENWAMNSQIVPSIFSLCIGIVTIFYVVGYIGFLGVSMMGFTFVCNVKLADLGKKYEKIRLAKLDARLSVTSRALDAMKAVKFCAWEDRFLTKIKDNRNVECLALKKYRSLSFINTQIGRVTPIWCAAFTYICLVILGKDLDPGTVYAVMTVFQGLRLPLTVIPLSMSYIAKYRVSLDRIMRYLMLPEYATLPAPGDASLAVRATNVTAEWPTAAPETAPAKDTDSRISIAFAIRDIELTLRWGMNVAMVGCVGSGKTSLLSAILGGLNIKTEATLASDLSSVGFVPQRAFVINGTVLENVVFGRPWNSTIFDAAVYAASLDTDLEQLPNGRETEIGEKGVTLSGGQQQRVGIARALYGCPKLLVLDDPLAAVDGRVARQIFSDALLNPAPNTPGGKLIPPGGRLVFMVLNQFRFLHNFDHVVYLDCGRVQAQGGPTTLLSSNESFSAFVGGIIGDDDALLANGQVRSIERVKDVQEDGFVTGKQGLVGKETQGRHFVPTSVYKRYFRGMGAHRIVTAVVLEICAYGSMAFSDRWLSVWVNAGVDADDTLYACIYLSATVSFAFSMCAAALAVGFACVATAQALHHKCIDRVMHAPVTYFESTPSGRIMSRFGADLGMVDNMLAMLVEATTTFFFTLLVFCVMIISIAPLTLPIMLIAGVAYYIQVTSQDRTNRQVKRMANNALSVPLTCLGELGEAHAKVLVRSMRFEEQYCTRFDRALDSWNEYQFISTSLISLAMLISYFIAFVISLVASLAVLRFGSAAPAEIGLSLTYAFLLPYFLQMLAQIASMLKNGFLSLERLLSCMSSEIPQEPSWDLPHDTALTAIQWPQKGMISFEDVTLIYRPGLPPAIKKCSFVIPGGSKVGVVGRTGAGKSSLFVLLFRLVDAAEGKIIIDGQSIMEIGLLKLRRNMAIIPQEPLLLEGNVQANIDPFNEFSKPRISEILRSVGLGDRGETEPAHLSAGEKQLLQMARTLIRNVRVIVMDEPTSNIDPNTDILMQHIVRKEFSKQTLITIAHRIDTIIDADRVLVMDKGCVAEYASPKDLIRRSGIFAAMVNGEGEARAADLRRRAELGTAVDPNMINLVIDLDQNEKRDHASRVSPFSCFAGCAP